MRTLTIALLAAIVAAPLMAQDPPPPPAADEALEAFFKFNDVDANEKITLDEAVTRIRSMFAELRKAGSDEKKKAEVWKANELLVTSRQFACADASNNGTVTKDEWRGYLDKFGRDANLKPEILQTDTQARIEFHETGYDADESDSWTRIEARDIDEADFKAYDTDNDTKVTIVEFIKLRGAALRKECKYSEDEYAVLSDPFALYRKAGRNWTTKNYVEFGEMKMTTYSKIEVISVSEEEAELVMIQMDENKKETVKHEYKMPLKMRQPDDLPQPDVPKIETTEPRNETIKVEAGEFECIVMDVEFSGFKTSIWTSKRFPGLTVKTVMKGDGINSTMELVEFNDEAKPVTIDPFALYKKKGRSWTQKITVKEGDVETVHFEKYEILEVLEDRAQVKVTTLDKDMKAADAEPEQRSVLFKSSGISPVAAETKAEKIKVNAGEIDCEYSKVVLEEGHVIKWMHKSLKGLVVKSESKGRTSTTTVELWELKD